MTNYNIPEIDGLKIIHREPGWEDEWGKALIYLLQEEPELLNSYCKHALKPYAWLLWEFNGQYILDAFKNHLEEFRSHVLTYWKNEYLNKERNYDPKRNLFIKYLLGSIFGCHLAEKYVENGTTAANSLIMRNIRAIKAAGRRNGKTYDEIEKDIQQYRLRVKSLSEMDRSDATNEDINGNGFDVLEAKPDSQNQIFQDLKYLIKQFIKHLDKKYLEEEYKEDDESKSITQVYRQAGAQLYPDMIESNLSDSPEAWTYSAQKQPVCNQKGIQCIIQKTLNIIKQNNPEQSPELTLYDVHYKAALETDCKKDEESETAVESYPKSPIVIRYFRPIKNIADLKLLFGIPSRGSAVKERFLYMQEVGKWIKKIIEQRKEESACDK